MTGTTLHDRLATVAGNRTYRAMAELTKTNHETVRQYMQGAAPSVEFLTGVCAALQINAAWLLSGEGPMRAGDIRSAALEEADVAELLSALSNSLTTLIERVERLEIYVQTMESRLRSSTPPSTTTPASPSGQPWPEVKVTQRGEPVASEQDVILTADDNAGRATEERADGGADPGTDAGAGGAEGTTQRVTDGERARRRARRLSDTDAERPPSDDA